MYNEIVRSVGPLGLSPAKDGVKMNRHAIIDMLPTLMSKTAAFNTLVAIGAACTAAAWLLVPLLRRHRPAEGAAVI